MIHLTITGLFLLLHLPRSMASTPIGDNICYGGTVAFENCAELKTAFPTAETGDYKLSVGCGDASCCKDVYCQMELKGGGWTVFQRRFDGSLEFYRDWADYENGFGSISGEHWLGLSYLSTLLSSGGPWDLLLTVDEPNYPECVRFQQFDRFSVGNAASKYLLGLGNWLDGNLEYANLPNSHMSDSENGNVFSTYDQDNDNSALNCAQHYNGWWHNDCHNANLNGLYGPSCTPNNQGISVRSAGDDRYAFAGSMLAFRPNGFPDEPIPNQCNATQTDFHTTCPAAPTGGNWQGNRCGPWGHWEDWTNCPSTPGCGIASVRYRHRVNRYEDYIDTWPNCIDGSDPNEVQTDAGFCFEDCSDSPIPIADNLCDGGSKLYKDCADIKEWNPAARTWVYRVSAGCSTAACCRPVYCEMDSTIGGGGWTVFQRRFNGTLNFFRNWTEYEEGFGLTQSEHWMGLKHLHEFVKDGPSYELMLKVYEEKYPNCLRFELYSGFTIGNAISNYKLSMIKYKGGNNDTTCPNCNCVMHTMSSSGRSENGNMFSTPDRDQDCRDDFHCAEARSSGWWFGFCGSSNLNAIYRPGCTAAGLAMSLHRGTCSNFAYSGTEVMFRKAGVPFETAYSNVCTQSEVSTCKAFDGSEWNVRTCGHWLEWSEWSACTGPTTCRRTRTRGRVIAIVPSTFSGCEDGTSADYLDAEYEHCNHTCDSFCGASTKQPTKKLVMGSDIIQIIASTTDVNSCSLTCLTDLRCRAFQVDINTQTCVLSDSQLTSVLNSDSNIHLYFLN